MVPDIAGWIADRPDAQPLLWLTRRPVQLIDRRRQDGIGNMYVMKGEGRQ